MNREEQIGVLVVDHHNTIRDSMALFFESFADIKLVGEATNTQEAVLVCAQVSPDVVLLDPDMPDVRGLAAIRTFHQSHPSVAIIAMLGFQDRFPLEELYRNGAVGHVRKDAPIDRLAAAVRSAHLALQRRIGHQPSTEGKEGKDL